MNNREESSVSVIGVNRTSSQRNGSTHRRVSAREARKRKKRKKMIRLYTRLALLIGGAGLVVFIGIWLVSSAFSAISGALSDSGSRQGENILGNGTPVVDNGSDNHNAGQVGEESSQGPLSGVDNDEEPSHNTGDNPDEGSEKPDDPIQIVYGDDLYNDGEFVVCVDPGHGGNDVGCVGVDGSYEKDDVLKLADYLVYLLEEAGVKVVQTRSVDVWVDLEDRPAFANEQNADLLISLHRNIYSADESVKGFEAWINSTDSDNSEELAKLIMGGLESAGISKNRGVKKGSQGSEDENYAVNAGSKMPSVLLEMGFMSSPTDNQLFRNNTKAYAQAIADAIIQWSQGKQY